MQGHSIDFTKERLNLSHACVFDMRHKILLALEDISAKEPVILQNVSELDETYVLDWHLGYEKNSIEGNNSGNSRNGYSRKRIISDYGECEIAVPRDRNGEFKPQIIGKRQTRTSEIGLEK